MKQFLRQDGVGDSAEWLGRRKCKPLELCSPKWRLIFFLPQDGSVLRVERMNACMMAGKVRWSVSGSECDSIDEHVQPAGEHSQEKGSRWLLQVVVFCRHIGSPESDRKWQGLDGNTNAHAIARSCFGFGTLFRRLILTNDEASNAFTSQAEQSPAFP